MCSIFAAATLLPHLNCSASALPVWNHSLILAKLVVFTHSSHIFHVFNMQSGMFKIDCMSQNSAWPVNKLVILKRYGLCGWLSVKCEHLCIVLESCLPFKHCYVHKTETKDFHCPCYTFWKENSLHYFCVYRRTYIALKLFSWLHLPHAVSDSFLEHEQQQENRNTSLI